MDLNFEIIVENTIVIIVVSFLKLIFLKISQEFINLNLFYFF